MQKDFDANFPELGINIIGINEAGLEAGNPLLTAVLPWLQDVDADGDNQSDVWQSWDAEWLDLTILDRNNVPVITFNMRDNLADPANYDRVRQAFLDIATDGAL